MCFGSMCFPMWCLSHGRCIGTVFLSHVVAGGRYGYQIADRWYPPQSWAEMLRSYGTILLLSAGALCLCCFMVCEPAIEEVPWPYLSGVWELTLGALFDKQTLCDHPHCKWRNRRGQFVIEEEAGGMP